MEGITSAQQEKLKNMEIKANIYKRKEDFKCKTWVFGVEEGL